MAKSLSVLIVEDDAIVALGLAFAAEDVGATVVGPAASAVEALTLLGQGPVDAAILDVNLADRDMTPVAIALIEAGVPFLVHTGTGLPADLAAAFPELPVVRKPVNPTNVLARLLSEVKRSGPGLGSISSSLAGGGGI